MYAIIRQGEGKYYVSAVFGYYKDITATDDYEKYLQNIYNAYYVVWDAEGKRLARCLAMVPKPTETLCFFVISDYIKTQVKT